jgi:SAM-dependent methyltransferase
VLRRRGVLGTARQALVQALYLLRYLWPSHFRAWAAWRAAERAADAAFDRTHSVDTRGRVHITAMHDVESENWVYGINYMPTRVDLFEQMIGVSAIEPHRHSFIDYGSGKGRVLLLASRLPFRRVVGVEFSPKLHRIAERNLRSIRIADRRSGPVESICMDAVRFPIPEEPVVLYFFNPFERPIMETVRDNVVRSYEGNPRSIVVIYLNPMHSDLWDAVGFLKRYAWSNEYVIYKTSSLRSAHGSVDGR